MGQRLNIEIRRKKDNKILANSYYHWSAYTYSSLKLANEIIENIYDIIKNNKVNDEIKAIQLLQTTGAGLLEQEYNTLNEEDKKYCSLATNRNLGLISFTEKGIEETRTWEEGRLTITIDFDNKEYDFVGDKNRVDFEVYFPISREEIEEYYKEELKSGKINLDEVVEFNFDLQDMKLNDIRLFMAKINQIENNFGIFMINGAFYQIIY
jgi:hypothetical protein